MMYIWSSSMKRNFLRHLDIIVEKTWVLLPVSRILDQTLYFKNDDFLLERPNKPIFHKNLKDFFHHFPSMTFENTLLVDDTFHKSMFNPPYNAIFFKTFYGFSTNGNYFLDIILPYLESLHSSRMQVYKFVELNPFGSIMDMPLGDPRYEKLNARCFIKCHETFCNKVKSKYVNKNRWNIYCFIFKLVCINSLIYWINIGAHFVFINFVFKAN
jgi:hypothetical protein